MYDNIKEKEKEIRRLCSCGYDIHLVHSVDSTNNVLKKLAAEGTEDGYILIAEEQTAGKGRQGRSFFSPKSGIYMSLLIRPEVSPEKTLFYTTAAGVAVCRAIERETRNKAQIKWVNDVYIGMRKICGILVESSIRSGRTEWAVIGMGVNITPPAGGFPPQIADRACALFEQNAPEDFYCRFAAAMAEELYNVLHDNRRKISDEYRRRSMVIGMDVIAYSGSGEERKCKVIDVDDNAQLIVEYENGEKGRLYSGEVRIKI